MIAHFKLYKSCKILEEKSFMVDSLSDYLSTLSYIEDNINYFKFDKLEPVLKLELRQELAEMLAANDYNYIAITNERTNIGEVTPNTRTYYYFVSNKVWKSENCLELHLKLDVLNTFTYNTDYVVSNKTKVLREHRNRFQYVKPMIVYAEGYCTINANIQYQGRYLGTVALPPNTNLVGISTASGIIKDDDSTDTFTFNITSATGTLNISVSSLTQGYKKVYYKIYTEQPKVKARLVDAIPEGINPILYKGLEQEIIQTDLNTSWYLIYKNKDNIDPSDYNQVNPVECYCCADTPLLVSTAVATRNITYADLADDKYYFIGVSNNNGLELVFKDNTGYEYSVSASEASGQAYYSSQSKYIILHKAAGNNYFDVTYQYYYNISAPAPVGNKTGTMTTREASNITSLSIVSSIDKVYYAIGDTNSFTPFTTVQSGYFSFVMQDQYVNSIEGIDRTDSKLIKIFKIPYAPSGVIVNNNKITLGDNWDYDSTTSMFKLKNLNAKFNYTFDTPIYDPAMDLDGSIYPANNGIFPIDKLFINRDIKYESKLFNSEFYSPKFTYDSFGFQFDLERIDIAKYLGGITSEYFKIGFVMTTTINSRFMFYFPNYELLDYLKTQDYDKYLPIARNNEIALYTSQYINYIRTGYNYDVKAKNRTELGAGLGLGFGLAGSMATMGLGIASGNPAVAIGGLVGGISSIISNVVSTVNTIASAEANIEAKLQQAKAQAISVSGSDDIDLLDAYSNNKAKLCDWRCSNNMRNAIYNLFYYCGYATNEMKAPNLYTRMFFNFIQAELVINENNNLPDFVTKELVSRFKSGVTVIHLMQDVDQNKIWDFEQHYENWEQVE